MGDLECVTGIMYVFALSLVKSFEKSVLARVSNFEAV